MNQKQSSSQWLLHTVLGVRKEKLVFVLGSVQARNEDDLCRLRGPDVNLSPIIHFYLTLGELLFLWCLGVPFVSSNTC